MTEIAGLVEADLRKAAEWIGNAPEWIALGLDAFAAFLLMRGMSSFALRQPPWR